MSVESKRLFRPRISLVVTWLIFCSFCSFIGLVLSLVHQLNVVGYGTTLGLSLVAFLLWKKKSETVFIRAGDGRKLRHRFRRVIPLCFLVVSALAILGGILHPPSNYDGLAYRTPRVLHWLAANQWHWIHTDFNRLNTRAPAYEWVTAPLIALARTDRFEFVIDVICFLLLPGRVFSIWTRLGVRPRVAWYWMWLFPSGYCYITEAASIGNDIFGALLAMVAIEYALRARRSGRIGEFVVSMLAAALMTSGKAYNLLLLLPWAVAAGPALWLLLKRPFISFAAVLVALSISIVPTSVLNYRNCGDWTGLKAEKINLLGNGAPVFHVTINSILVVVNNLAPPIFPFSKSWEHLTERVVSPAIAKRLSETFEPGVPRLAMTEMQTEEYAGLGLGLTALLIITLVYRIRFRSRSVGATKGSIFWFFNLRWLIPLSAWVGVFVFMSKSGMMCPSRYLAPFFPLLIVPILAGDGAISRLIRRVWWQRAAMVVFGMAIILIIVSPARPLFPAVTILHALGAENSSHALLRRAWMVYSVYGDRSDAFAPAVALLPTDANPLGVVTSDDPETSLWRPFGARRIKHVCGTDGPEYLRDNNIKYVLVSSPIVAHDYQMSMDDWMKKYNAELVQPVTLSLRAGVGPVTWYLVKVR